MQLHLLTLVLFLVVVALLSLPYSGRCRFYPNNLGVPWAPTPYFLALIVRKAKQVPAPSCLKNYRRKRTKPLRRQLPSRRSAALLLLTLTICPNPSYGLQNGRVPEGLVVLSVVNAGPGPALAARRLLRVAESLVNLAFTPIALVLGYPLRKISCPLRPYERFFARKVRCFALL